MVLMYPAFHNRPAHNIQIAIQVFLESSRLSKFRKSNLDNLVQDQNKDHNYDFDQNLS